MHDDKELADLGIAGDGGADGSNLGVCGGVRPVLPVLDVDDFRYRFLYAHIHTVDH